MPDIIIYPNGKPVRVKWFDQDPPTEDDIDEMYDTYAKSQQPVNTGRVGPSTNRVPSGFNRQIDVSGGFAPVVPGTTPGVGNPVPKPSTGDPNQRHEIKPVIPASPMGIFDQVAKQVRDINNQPQPYTGPKATPQNNIILGGLQQQTNAAQKAKQLQKGPSIQNVQKQIEQNQVKNVYNKQKAVQAWANQQIINNAVARQQTEVAAGNPNYIGSEQAAQDIYTNQGQLPSAEQVASQKAAQARNLAHDPLRQLQAGPAGLFGAAASALPHAFVEASSGMNEDIAKNLKPVEDLASYLVPVIGDAKFAGDMAKSLSSGDYSGLAQNAALVLGAHFGIPLLSKAKEALSDLSKVGNYAKFDESLGQLGLEPNARAAIVQQIKSNPLAELKGFDANGKPIVRVKAQGTEPSLASQPSPVGETNASQNPKTAEVHGNLQSQPGEGKIEVPPAQSEQGIQSEAPSRVQTTEAKQAQEVAAPKPAEPPPGPATQFRHEDTAQIRQKLGLPEYQGGGTNWDDAIKKAFSEGHVERADSLVEDIKNGNRHVFKPEERAGVAIKGQALSDHLDTIGQQMDAAKAAGDQAGYDALRGEYNDTKGRINDYLDALDKSGSGAGDALQSSKIKFGKQTDPVRIERDFEAATGRKPNEQESADLEKLRQEVIRAQKAQADAESARQVAENARAEAEARANFAEEQRQARQTTRRTKSETIDAQIDELGKKWREKITNLSANPVLDPEAYKIIAQAASLYIQKGVLKFEDVLDSVKAHFEGVTDRHVIDAMSGNYEKEPRTTSELAKQKKDLYTMARHVSRVNDALEGIVRVSEKLPPDELAQKLKAVYNEVLKLKGLSSGSDIAKIERIESKTKEALDQLKKGYRPIPSVADEVNPAIKDASKKLSDVRARIRTQDSIYDLEEQLRTGEFKEAVKPSSSDSPELKTLKEQASKLREDVAKAKEGLKPGEKRPPNWDQIKSNLETKLKEISDQYEKGYRPIREKKPDAPQAIKDLQKQISEVSGNMRIQDKIYDIEHQIRTGNLKPKRPANVLSPERQKLQADLGKANQRLRYYIESKKKIGPVELLSRVQRFSILSGPSVFGKLGVATASHSLITPIEDLVGVGAGKLSGLKGVEATASLRGDVAAVKEFFKKETWRDVWSKAKGQGNTLGNAYGTEKFKGGPVWEFFGNLHGAVKTPLQRAAFQKEAIKMTDFLASKGVDVTKPEVITSITAHAYQKSLEAILMNDSKAVQQARKIIDSIPHKVGQTIAPIVRVPINFAGRTGEYIAGLPYGAGKQILAKISKTPLDEAAQNAILRAYKRGSVGAALGVVGFYHPDLTDDLPSWAKHTPVVETLALGGALRKGWEQADHTKKGTTSDTFTHLGSAVYHAGNEYAQNLPGLETVSKVLGGLGSSDVQAEGKLGKAAADYITSFFVPQLFQQVGKMFDPEAVKKGENYYKTQGFREEIAKNTPGLRQTLADVPIPKDDWWAKSDSKEFKETQGLDLKFSAPDWIKDKTKSNYDATSQQYNQRYRAISVAIQKSVHETLADPGYIRMSNEDKARVLKRIVESARKETNAQVNASRH